MDNYILDIECKGMKNKEKFPIEYTGRGENISPEFNVENLSKNAKSLVITLEDLTHPINKFTHWIIWNVPAANKIPGAIKKVQKLMSLTMQGRELLTVYKNMQVQNLLEEKYIGIYLLFMR